jgi:FKBP-type peptidyl-prolyl cis-trans isomerase FkpA
MKKLQISLIILAVLSLMVSCKKGGSAGKTPSGYSYTVHKSGSGSIPKEGDYVSADMYVRKDTTLLYSSNMRGRSELFIIEDIKDVKDPVTKMLLEGVRLLKKGDSATFVMNLDTMKTKPAGFEGGKEARITFSVKDVMNEDGFVKTLQPQEKEMFLAMKPIRARAKAVTDSTERIAKDYAAGKTPANTQTTASGLKYAIFKEGTGAMPKKGQMVSVHYYGALKDGISFDQSFQRGQPISFPIGQGQVIPGWDEGLMLFKEGSTGALIIPANLAYGDKVDPNGPIPPNAELIFYVDLIKVADAPAMPAMPQMPPTQR